MKRTLIMLTLFCLLLSGTVGLAENAQDEILFRGIPWGTSLSDFIETMEGSGLFGKVYSSEGLRLSSCLKGCAGQRRSPKDSEQRQRRWSLMRLSSSLKNLPDHPPRRARVCPARGIFSANVPTPRFPSREVSRGVVRRHVPSRKSIINVNPSFVGQPERVQ